jgi:hypothetical protein
MVEDGTAGREPDFHSEPVGALDYEPANPEESCFYLLFLLQYP